MNFGAYNKYVSLHFKQSKSKSKEVNTYLILHLT